MFKRSQYPVLQQRLREPRRFIQILSGPRQVGKTTLIRQVMKETDRPIHYASADLPALQTASWIRQQWETARTMARQSEAGAILVLDEVQKLPLWAETVKGLWDADIFESRPLHVVLSGSSPLLIQKGLTESLAGRFEIIPMPHWGFAEMEAAFDLALEQYLYYGGYPGAIPLIHDPEGLEIGDVEIGGAGAKTTYFLKATCDGLLPWHSNCVKAGVGVCFSTKSSSPRSGPARITPCSSSATN